MTESLYEKQRSDREVKESYYPHFVQTLLIIKVLVYTNLF